MNARQEMALGLVSSQEIERLHSIQPTRSLNAKRNPWMFDPLKIGYVQQLTINWYLT